MESKLLGDDLRFVNMCRALGNPIRFEIIKEISRCESCMCGNIVPVVSRSQTTVYQHLQVLKDAGLIRSYEDGPSVCYCLDRDNLDWFMHQSSNFL